MKNPSRQNSNSNLQIQNQQLKQKTSQISSEEQILKYTVRQDFLNVIGIAVDFQTAQEQLQDDKTQEQLIKVMQNRLILQVNLSNSIHSDLSYQYKNQAEMQQLLMGEKQKIKEHLENTIQQNQFNKEIKVLLKSYADNNLIDNPKLITTPLEQIDQKAEFNQETIQKVLCSMNITDQKYRDLQSGKAATEELSPSYIKEFIEKRKNDAESKIKIKNQDSKTKNKNQESSTKKQETRYTCCNLI